MELSIIVLIIAISLFFIVRNLIKICKGEKKCNCSYNCNSCNILNLKVKK